MSDEERQRRLIDKVVQYEREESRAEGEARGETKGMIRTLMDFIRDGLISEDNAAERANMSLEDFRKAAMLYSN